MGNETIAVFRCGNAAKASPLFQWDYGQILQVEGIELPDVWTAHFANDARGGDAYQAIGGADGVTIPDELLTTGKTIYCWIYLHTGEDDGETVWQITIPVIPRPEPTEEQPTPEQQGVIDQAIAALGVAVEEAQAAATAAGTAQGKAEDAQAAAELAQGKAEDAQTAAEAAQGRAEGYATDAGGYSQSAKGYRDQASSAKNLAESSAQHASASALQAEGYAVGKQSGADVGSGSPYYHNNAYYFAGQASASATAAAASAAHYPYIGSNGHWYAWDSGASAMVDTGIPASGVEIVRVGVSA